MSDWFERVTFAEALDRAAERFPDRVALTFRGESRTFRELHADVERAAAGLARAGVESGDAVALWMDNRPEWIHVFFACARLGAVFVPLNTGLRSDDCRYALAHSECSTLVFATSSGPVSYVDVLAAIAPDLAEQQPGSLRLRGLPSLRRVVALSTGETPAGCLEWRAVVDAAREDEPVRRTVDADGVATIMYTSGTTGAPKGVMQSHHALRNVTDQANRLNVRESDVILMFLPLHHAYGLYEGPLLSVITGARTCLMERFDAGSALETLEAERATLCFGFSTHFQDMLSHERFERTDRSSLRAGILAVGPRSLEPLAYRVQREFGGKIVSGFGMTEIGVGATLGFVDEDERHSAATSGYPLSGYDFRIVDPLSGERRAAGEPGEVIVRGYQVMLGYLKDPEQTGRTVDADGWLHTGDIGVLEEDGYLKVLGRYKDMLRVAGENVDPAEVELLYAGHPAVGSAAVVGVPDPRLEEVPCLCVELQDGRELDDALRSELLSYADGRLASFKRPRHVLEFERLPITASGKLARADLKAVAEERLVTADAS